MNCAQFSILTAALVLVAVTATRAAVPATASQPAVGSQLYADIVQKYLATDWEPLIADFPKRTRDIAAMTKDQQADITYIRQAIAEGRPSWWNTVKQNKKTQITTRLWQRSFTATWDPALKGVQLTSTNGQITMAVNWPAADMDSPAPAEHGFTKGDLTCAEIWYTLETAQNFPAMSPLMTGQRTPEQKTRLDRYMAFRGTLAAAYYGTPRARRWAAFLSMDAYLEAHLNNEGFIPRRPVAAMLVAEIVSHPARYASLRIPKNVDASNAEAAMAVDFMRQFERTSLTFSEDKALRDALKEFAAASTVAVHTSGKATLPNKLTISLNPADDGPTSAQRNAWLVEQLAK